jgi:hypothetical protein
MSFGVVLTIYAGIGAYVAASVFYQGVLLGPRARRYNEVEAVGLSLMALVVGALWILFLPGLAVAAWRAARRGWASGRRNRFVFTKSARAET